MKGLMQAVVNWVVLCFSSAALTAPFDYQLKPTPIADGVYLFEGNTEHFTRDNGGNIVNTGFIVTDAGAVVIDTGPSRRYGEQMRAAVTQQTGKGIAQVFITHAHPDHFLGNQAYANDPIAALPSTALAIANIGDDLAANLYRLVGGWMEGTEALAPKLEAKAGEVSIGSRRLRLIALNGHTDADLAVYDEKTRTLFSGDLVFFNRTLTTPNADLAHWLSALDQLERLDFAVLVPGHGPVVKDKTAIAQTRAYLLWLRNALEQAAAQGLDQNEAMQIQVPPEFARLAVFRPEFERSVVHLYPKIEIETLKGVKP
ncbi:MAG: quinoprotein relay system zinc metallohydrolase 1 [Panacagrimonas sp.]